MRLHASFYLKSVSETKYCAGLCICLTHLEIREKPGGHFFMKNFQKSGKIEIVLLFCWQIELSENKDFKKKGHPVICLIAYSAVID